MNDLQKKLQSKNRLEVAIKIFRSEVQVGGIISKKFMSGSPDSIKDVLDAIGNAFTEPYDYKSFQVFVIREVDEIGRFRKFSAEKKWIFDFLKNEYSLGDRFDITLTSLLAPGVTDQRFLVMLQNLAKGQGKVLNLTYSYHPDAFSIKNLRTIIK
jgi:hypothetical protein